MCVFMFLNKMSLDNNWTHIKTYLYGGSLYAIIKRENIDGISNMDK